MVNHSFLLKNTREITLDTNFGASKNMVGALKKLGCK
jgi:hypothetical protein